MTYTHILEPTTLYQSTLNYL